MSVQHGLKMMFIRRFDELISDGEYIADSARGFTPEGIGSRNFDPDIALVFINKSCTLLDLVFPPNHPNRSKLKDRNSLRPNVESVSDYLAMLVAARDDFDAGFFDGLFNKIESEVAADYLGQAAKLLEDGSNGKHEFIPAAVLAGAVLERGLRTLCNSQSPAIPTLKANGEPLTMNPLIDDLKDAGVFNELRAKELRSWAGIRNAAAHGEFEKFNREQVERMVSGISSFLAEKL